MLKTKIDQDIKSFLLAGDRFRAGVLRNLKSAILYVEVERGVRDMGLDDEAALQVLAKESKKRQESADLYEKGGDSVRAKAELDEKSIIDSYLPRQLSEEELTEVVDAVIKEVGSDPKSMGQTIAEVKKRTRGQADGARIANIVKERTGK